MAWQSVNHGIALTQFFVQIEIEQKEDLFAFQSVPLRMELSTFYDFLRRHARSLKSSSLLAK